MYISKETKLLIKLLKVPGFGNKMAYSVAQEIIASEVDVSDVNIYSSIVRCINLGLIKVREEISFSTVFTAVNEANKTIDESLRNEVNIISKFDVNFPSLLMKLRGSAGNDVSPIILSYKGNLNSILEKKSIAIIGTRHPTSEGEEAGRYYSQFFAEKGYNIVSGLALGCDIIAHKGALSVTEGTTTAVLAHGLHTVSPKEHKKIAEEILEKGGVLLSEYLYGTPAFKSYFVERDRLQAGLSVATIVIQTGIQGGTMHAANATMNNGKILAAVSYKDPNVRNLQNVTGNDFLIARGAYPLRVADAFYDFLEEGEKLEYKKESPTFF